MTDEELDQRIREALLLAAQAEYDFRLPGEPEELPIPPALERRMRPLLSDPFGRRRRLRRRAYRSAAAVALAAALTAGTALAVSPEARAWVRNMVVHILEEYTTVRFADDTGAQTDAPGEWAPAWLPEGYELAEASTLGNLKIRLYINQSGHYIDFEYTESNYRFNVDNEHHTAETVIINGNPAYFLRATVPDYASSLTWYSDASGMAFLL